MKKKTDRLVSPATIVNIFKERSFAIRGSKDSFNRSKIATIWSMCIDKTVTSALLDAKQLDTLLNSLGTNPLPEIIALQVYFGGVKVLSSGVFQHQVKYMATCMQPPSESDKNNTKMTLSASSSSSSSLLLPSSSSPSGVGSPGVRVHETFELVPTVGRPLMSIYSSNINHLVVNDIHHIILSKFSSNLIKHIEYVTGCEVANIVIQVAFDTSREPVLVAAKSILLQNVNHIDSKSAFIYASGSGPGYPTADNLIGILPTALFEKSFIGTDNSRALHQRDKVQNVISNSMGQMMEYLDVLMPNEADYDQENGFRSIGSSLTNSKIASK